MIKKILVVLVVLLSAKAMAQRNNSSPYSFFGIGEEFHPKTAEQAAMGGIGVAFGANNYINFINPAANANLRYATYSFGGLVNRLTLNEPDASQTGTSTSLQYVALGFPIGSKAGASFGIQPLTSVGYSLTSQILDTEGEVLSATKFQGAGGTNRLYASFGVQVFKGLSLGVETGFIFGTIDNSILNQRDDVHLASKHKQVAVIRGSAHKLGLQYQAILKGDLTLHAGATVRLENTMKATGNELLYSLSFGSAGTEVPRDTILNIDIVGKITDPIQTIVGLGLGKSNKWYVGANYESKNALKSQGYLIEEGTAYAYGKSNRFSVGGFYIPKTNSIASYWDRVTYRAGIRLEKTGLLVDGTGTATDFTSIDDFGISFGLGLPLGKKLSNLNLGLAYGKKGTTENQLIQEEYFNVRMSLSLNDLWFQKRRID